MTLAKRKVPEDENSNFRRATRVIHRRYVSHTDSHYSGGLVNGAFVLGLFGDVATDLCIQTDADEGLLASFADVQFIAPIRSGDVIEVEASLQGVGQRSRRIRFEARVMCRSEPARGASAAGVLVSPLVVGRAEGTVVVPAAPAGTTERNTEPVSEQ